jgi:hypothetical protein
MVLAVLKVLTVVISPYIHKNIYINNNNIKNNLPGALLNTPALTYFLPHSGPKNKTSSET